MYLVRKHREIAVRAIEIIMVIPILDIWIISQTRQMVTLFLVFNIQYYYLVLQQVTFSMSFEEKARSAIQSIIKDWTKKYLHNITLVDSSTSQYVFMVQFSLPTAEKPVSIGTVQVYFYVQSSNPIQIRFRFEKDSLIHSVNQTLRSSQMQNWIQSLLHKKLLIRENVFYLGTQYQVTRVKDARQDKILEVKQIPIEEEYVYISPELLTDQKRAVQMDSRVLSKDFYKIVRDQFLSVDKDQLGVVTNNEFIQILNNLELKLDDKEINQILNRVDKDKQGLIKFQEYRQVADEIIKTMIAKQEALQRLRNNEQQYKISSLMMLMGDKVHDIYDILSAKFKRIDEDQLGHLRLPDVKKILQELNLEIVNRKILYDPNQKKSKKNKSQEGETSESLLTLMQLQEFTKKLSERYPFAQVKYNNIVKQLIQFKLANLRKGLLDSNQTLLQVYLRDQFSQKDNQRFGKIHMSDLVKALEQSDKIKLTKGQLYVIKSIVEKDGNNMVNYLPTSKSLAEIIKRMYLTHEKMRENNDQLLEIKKQPQVIQQNTEQKVNQNVDQKIPSANNYRKQQQVVT